MLCSTMCPNLSLELVSQNLMNKLPELVPNVTSICIRDLDYEDKLIVAKKNFSFLSKFKGLKTLLINKCCISIDLIKKILENCKRLEKLTIKCVGSEEIKIENGREYWTSLGKCEFQDEISFPSKTELLEYLEQNRILKKHFFDEFFSENYFLDDQLTITDYFYDQSH